jgi:hypothetical protein
MRHTSGNQECTIQRDWQHEAHTRQPRMYNPETLATLGTQAKTKNVQSRDTGNIRHTSGNQECTQDTGRRQNTTQHRKLKRLATRTPPTIGGEPMCSRMVSSSCLLLDSRHVTHIMKTVGHHYLQPSISIYSYYDIQ